MLFNLLISIVTALIITFVIKTHNYVRYYPMFLKFAGLAILNVFVFFTAYFGAWFLPLFAIGKDHLPSWLSYFDTPDNPLDGDEGFINIHAPYPGKQTGIKQYLNRAAWLRRNPSYGFDFKVLGKKITEKPIVLSGDPLISDGPNLTTGRPIGLSGHVFIVTSDSFEYYSVKQKDKDPICNRIRVGWKLSGYINEPDNHPLDTNAQFVCTFKFGSKFSI